MIKDKQILLHFKHNLKINLDKYKRKQSGSKGQLRTVPKLLLAIDYLLVAQELYLKHLPLENKGNVKTQVYFMFTNHCFLYHHHVIHIPYKKLFSQSEHVVHGLYPDAMIAFKYGRCNVMTNQEYHSYDYKAVINDLLELKGDASDCNTGALVLDIIDRLHSLTNLKKRTVLYIDLSLNLCNLKQIAHNYAHTKLHLNQHDIRYNKAVKRLYLNNIYHHINLNISNHNAYLLMLKIMCNLGVGIKMDAIKAD